MDIQKPIIFLAFANDHGDKRRYLRKLPDEYRQLRKVLKEAVAKGLCELREEPFATIDHILDVFLKHRDRIGIFHFAGHSNSYELLLEDKEGKVKAANADGLAAFLGEQKGLRLIFLNGCSNREQVQGLLEANIPAVIATYHDILDDVAMEFASLFYQALATEVPIRRAYDEAKASIEIKFGDGQSRGALRRTHAAPSNDLPWDLFVQDEDQTADQWSLITPIITQPRRSFEPEMIPIPGGEFWMGCDPDEEGARDYETPRHRVKLPFYFIGKYPVTNKEYSAFVKDTKYRVRAEAGWEGQKPPTGKDNHPMMAVTWYDALAYCDWLSKKTGRSYTLPSEAEWEKAARGKDDSRPYPWGEWAENRCNHNIGEITPVDKHEAQSDYGCFDMVGNVREWTRTLWGTNLSTPDPEFAYPWPEDGHEDGRNELESGEHLLRVYRGGALADERSRLTCGARHAYDPTRVGPRYKRHGFRVVRKITNTSTY